METFRRGIEAALTFLEFPSGHHRSLKSTNALERLIREIKRRTRGVGVFPNGTSAGQLSTAVLIRSTEEWALRRYFDMEPLIAMNASPQN